MPTITKASEMDGLWVASKYDAKVRKIELYEGRSQNKGRTLLSRLYPGHQALAQYSNSFWDIFVMTGDLEVNGERLATREHFLCYPYQDVQYRTETGCELLIFIRTNHFWSSQNPKRSQIIRISDWSWIVSKNDSKAEKVDLYDGRDGGRSIVSRVKPGVSAGVQSSSVPWDIFVLDGDLSVNSNGCGPGDHLLCLADEAVSWRSESGCTCLVFVRRDHRWVK